MQLFDVYPIYDIELTCAQGVWLWDTQGQKYLDLYGGHAVISIGHTHPHYVKRLTSQLQKIGFYSNSVQISLQTELAQLLGELSKYPDYQLFLCNSGAEANENALKMASFHTQKSRVLFFERAFHGRTSATVAITDNPAIIAPLNAQHQVTKIAWNDTYQLATELQKGDVCAVIIEGIQGVGGIHPPSTGFLKTVASLCKKYQTVLILDEIQSGYGRTGKFFAHQWADIQPDIITIAKGMGNGFPVAGMLLAPQFEAKKGLLGTTFGGNHLACAAALAVLEVIQSENLIDNAYQTGEYLLSKLRNLPCKEVRGKGLMLGIEFEQPVEPIRQELLFKHHIFTGVSGKHTLRLLPPLTIQPYELDIFVNALFQVLNHNSQIS
ncbi:MAG: aminotransferase class III-fold pyridoxal phosphate-dependent enzyme [Microscillaceae bacterium]|nr:aminotransferase class III-fold pyridoxal phosphate-dependent enzyme [Microscillaceae bacterium]MDW8461491.1 aminotransferase class III-fold pyridoxal phosphate-dependent enzyme [Cytophagales bacterium]